MQNSLESSFRGLTYAIIQDIIAYKPNLQQGLIRDMSRIDSLVSNAGIRIYTEFLPALRKQLDSGVSISRLELSGPLTRSYKSSSHIPRLFRGLWAELFDDDGCLKQAIDPSILLMFRCLLDAGNKFKIDCPPSAVFRETKEFYDNDVSLPTPSPMWDGDGSDIVDTRCVSLIDRFPSETDQVGLFESGLHMDTKLLANVQHVADIVASSLGIIDTYGLGYRHGRGSVADQLRGREKYLPRRWSPRLSRLFPVDSTVLPVRWEHDYTSAEYHSVLHAVPKTIKGPRLIAIEPVDHMVCQLGIMDHLYSHVRRNPYLRSTIDFRNQGFSRDLALESSRTGEYATIDLKSASDRISCWLVERMFRSNRSLLEALISSRTRYISLAMDKKLPSLHKLRKFSTQGSAVTFPIQSIIFATLCVGAVAPIGATAKTIRRLFRRVRVYGDDIIVPTDWLSRVKLVLEGLYLRVNTTKTHSQGKFRESCGMDGYDGYDVTPAHVTSFTCQSKRRLSHEVIAASNNFYTKGLWRAAQWLMLTVPEKYRNMVPVRKESDVSIYFTSVQGNWEHPSLKKRWDPDIQVEQSFCLSKSPKQTALEVDGLRGLCAFLMRAENSNREPFLGMVPELTFSSRWEVLEKISGKWVTLTS